MLDELQQAYDAVVRDWGPALLQGAVVTLEISLGAFALGLVIGLATALVKLGGHPLLKRLANAYTSVCRSLPELLLILLLYYAGGDAINALAALLGQPQVEVNGFAAAIVVLGIVQGAYAAEIMRGAVQAIPHGHIEAARAFGCGRWLTARRV
ncbi:ABC transporter permease, partial [Pseudomonas sp. MWU13-2860]